jgi:uncharacterized protein (TIGR00661 family)
MKILYCIQATGNGHLSRATEILPILHKICDTIDICVSGTMGDIPLAYPVKYQLKGISFRYNKKGAIDYLKSIQQVNLKRFKKEMQQVPVKDYDLVINDFEPVTAWACKLKNVNCIGLSHQAAVTNENSPKPAKRDLLAQMILKHYAPVKKAYGFHFKQYDKSMFTPVIRSAIRNATPSKMDYYTVYLPAYSAEKLYKRLSNYKSVEWQIFSKDIETPVKLKNCQFYPVDGQSFANSLIHCKGVLCGAGFETPAEALYLGKKLMVIPIKGQYEQFCNAAALADLGVPVIKGLRKDKYKKTIREWLLADSIVKIAYKDNTEMVLQTILHNHIPLVEYHVGQPLQSIESPTENFAY